MSLMVSNIDLDSVMWIEEEHDLDLPAVQESFRKAQEKYADWAMRGAMMKHVRTLESWRRYNAARS